MYLKDTFHSYSENLPVNVALNDSQRGAFNLRLPARSWHTVVYK